VGADEMLRHLDEAGLSRFDLPEYYVSLERLPVTPNGKVLKRELVESIRRGEIRPEAVRFATTTR
jgi:acyl-CoA synthetase